MKNNTKNNTNKTMKQLVMAASVALTMGVAGATTVPGIPGDVFEFSQPGLADGATGLTGGGVSAIANINAILDAVGNNGGTALDKAAFWGSAVEQTRTQVFEYNDAAPMIEELIFTVLGEAHGINVDGETKYQDASLVLKQVTDGLGFQTLSNARDVFLSRGSETGTGSYVDGKLAHTQQKAMDLLTLLNFTANHATESVDSATSVITNAGGVAITGPHSTDLGTKVTGGTYTVATDGSITSNRDSQVEVAVEASRLNVDGFNNANELIALIADQLKTGYILDVDMATENLAAIAAHHNGFLSASLVSEAHGLKDVVKIIGYQTAAAGVGKGARTACTGGDDYVNGIASGTKESLACTNVGQAFKDMLTHIPAITVSDPTTMVSSNDRAVAYQGTLDAINAFADSIIGFNDTVDGFDATTAASEINGQFGTITVVEDSTAGSLYDKLENGPAPTFADISSSTIADNNADGIIDSTDFADIEGFSTALDIDGDGDFDLVFE